MSALGRRILVTGGCGYIGAVLVPMLLDRGYEVRVYDKLYFGDQALHPVKDKVEIIPGDVRTFDPDVLDGVEAVVHLGSLSNDPTADFNPKANYAINYEGTMVLAEACKERGITRFTFASTCACYGFHIDGVADETSPLDPQSDYAKSKLEAEFALIKLADENFVPVVLRQATVFGLSRRMRWDLAINAFVMHAFKNGHLDVWFGGEAWRPNVHVKDVAEAHIACLEADPASVRGEVFNLVERNARILELAHRVRKALIGLGIECEVEPNYDQIENRSYRVSAEKISRVLGVSPRVTVEQGVTEIAAALREGQYRDFDNPYYYNLPWMKLLVEVEELLGKTGSIF